MSYRHIVVHIYEGAVILSIAPFYMTVPERVFAITTGSMHRSHVLWSFIHIFSSRARGHYSKLETGTPSTLPVDQYHSKQPSILGDLEFSILYIL